LSSSLSHVSSIVGGVCAFKIAINIVPFFSLIPPHPSNQIPSYKVDSWQVIEIPP